MLGLHTQTASDEQPVQVSTDNQTDGDPALGQTGQVYRTRQAHQQPAAHVRCARRQGGDETAQAATAQNVIGKVLGAHVREQANQHHERDVHHKGDEHRSICSHWGAPLLIVVISATGISPHCQRGIARLPMQVKLLTATEAQRTCLRSAVLRRLGVKTPVNALACEIVKRLWSPNTTTGACRKTVARKNPFIGPPTPYPWRDPACTGRFENRCTPVKMLHCSPQSAQ